MDCGEDLPGEDCIVRQTSDGKRCGKSKSDNWKAGQSGSQAITGQSRNLASQEHCYGNRRDG